MATMKRTRRAVAVGAFLLAAGAAPVVSALTTDAATPQAGQGQCLAWFGARDTGKCIGWANTSAPAWSVGTNGVFIAPNQPGQSIPTGGMGGYGG